MKKSTWKLAILVLSGAAAAVGCSTAPASGTGGTGAGGSPGGGGQTGSSVGVLIMPDASGWVMADPTTNATKGIQGAWYGYGDHYGMTGAPPGDCETKGGHPGTACSVITKPTLPAPAAGAADAGFANVGGKMCTEGTGAMVIMGTNGMPDYSNIWGAGIALDLNNTGGANSVKSPYNAIMNGVTGFSFEMETPPLNSLRVEFPTQGVTNAAFWAGNIDQPSPVVAGLNVIKWADVKGPFYDAAAPPFDPTKIMSIQFHVFTGTGGVKPFKYCVSNLKALTN